MNTNIKQITLYSVSSILSAAIPATLVIIFSQNILSAFGSGYENYSYTLQIVMIAALFSSSQGVFSNALISSGRGWTRALSFCGWAVVIVSVFLALDNHSAVSAAISYTLAYIFLALFQASAVGYVIVGTRNYDRPLQDDGYSKVRVDSARREL